MYQAIHITDKTETDESVVHIWDDIQGHLTYSWENFDYAYRLDGRSGKYKTIYGDKVSKTRKWKKNSPSIFESDLPRTTRVLTDLYLDNDDVSANHRVLFFDIEVGKIDGEYADVTIANGPVTAIGCYINEKYTIFLLDEDNRVNELTKNKFNAEILTFKDEESLLKEFIRYYKNISPTVVTGWNIVGYDIPYLIHRLTTVFNNKVSSCLSPINIIKYNDRKERYEIAGVNILDYIEMYKKFTYTKRPNYRLDTIGQLEVKKGKVKFDGTLDNLYKTDIETFIKYNLDDVTIVVELDKELKLIDLVMQICHTGHVPYEDYPFSSRFIEGTIITYLHRQKRIAPNKNRMVESRTEEGFAGAFVKPPLPGLYEWVFNLDLQSLYPSIIMSLNIGSETIIGKVTNWDVDAYLSGELSHVKIRYDNIESRLTIDDFVSLMKEQKFIIASNGVIYRTDKKSVIADILDVWFKQRKEFKQLASKYEKAGDTAQATLYNQRQLVQKILLNSIYGVSGLPTYRFYNIDNAEAVTTTGQDIIKTSAKFVSNIYKKRGAESKSDAEMQRYQLVLNEELKEKRITTKEYNRLMNSDDHCIYIDTDSIFFSAVPLMTSIVVDPKQFTVNLAKELESKLNAFYNVVAEKMFFCSDHRFVIKGDSVSSAAVWITKKRYVSNRVYDLEKNSDINKDPKSVGLDVVRSSFPESFRQFMKNVFKMVLSKVPKKEIDDYVLKFRSDITQMKFNQVARNTSVRGITKYDIQNVSDFKTFPKGAPAHVKASIAYNRWLRQHKLQKKYPLIKDDENIKWVYIKNNEDGIQTMALKGYEDPPDLINFVEKHLDYDLLFRKELRNKLQDFYTALGWGLIPTDVSQHAQKFFEF